MINANENRDPNEQSYLSITYSSTTKNHFQVMERKITVVFFAIVEVWKKTIRKTSNFGHFYRIDLPE